MKVRVILDKLVMEEKHNEFDSCKAAMSLINQ